VGSDSNDIIELIHDNGIFLLMHADRHLMDQISSSRLFEAAAANVIIISDKNQFVIDNFGDNILYFDHNKSTEEQADEIIKHVEWIKKNPEKAKEMANNCHKIFLEKFTMEKQLVKLAKMHEHVLEQDRKKGYKFPTKYD
jgi:spore maturation protein CgeB